MMQAVIYLRLLASVPDSALYNPILYLLAAAERTLIHRMSAAKSASIKDSNTVIGYIRNNNYDTLYAGAFSLMYLWVNKDVSVTGTKYCTSDT
jgi:hypothetical protein